VNDILYIHDFLQENLLIDNLEKRPRMCLWLCVTCDDGWGSSGVDPLRACCFSSTRCQKSPVHILLVYFKCGVDHLVRFDVNENLSHHYVFF